MRLEEWVKKLAVKKSIKQGKFKQAFAFLAKKNSRHPGISIEKNGNIIYGYSDPSIVITPEEHLYSYEDLMKSFEIGYMVNHKSSNVPIKSKIYTIKISNGEETLLVKTPNENWVETLKNLYNAQDYLKDNTIVWEGKSIQLNKPYSSFDAYSSMRRFDNIIEYAKFESTIELNKENQ